MIRALGKHGTRILSAIFLFLIDIVLIVFAFLTGDDIYRILIIAFSSFAAISNILGIILPNLSCCKILNYRHIPAFINEDIFEDDISDEESSDFPPQNIEQVTVTSEQKIASNYNEPNQGYSSPSNNIYDVPTSNNAPPQTSPSVYPPPSTNDYPSPQ